MDGSYTNDDTQTDEDMLERDRILNERGIRREEVTDDEAEELVDDAEDSGDITDDDDKLSDVVTEEESDGND